MQVLAARLSGAPPELAKSLLQQAASADERGLAAIRAAVARIEAGAVVREANPRRTWTIRELGEAWTRGELARDYPDQIKVHRTADGDARLLAKHVYPTVGHIRVSELTLDDCEQVMRGMPQGRAANTRRNVALTLVRLMNLAVYPLRLRASNPMPKGFLPKPGKSRALNFLYPSEDARLLACGGVPLDMQLLFGLIVREGFRTDEALGLTWADLDLDRGIVRLDENKTDDPRAWALDPGVVRALSAWRPADFDGSDLLFPGREKANLAMWLRRYLKLAGVMRAELFTTTDARQRLRAHDLRGSFVTIALANGKTETWVADRTGHKSSRMISTYRRAARTAEEARLGNWTALDAALRGAT